MQIVTWGAKTSQVELYFVSLHGPHVLIGIISFITDFYFHSIHLLTMCTEHFLTNFQHLSFLDILCIGNNVVVRLRILKILPIRSNFSVREWFLSLFMQNYFMIYPDLKLDIAARSITKYYFVLCLWFNNILPLHFIMQ